MPDGSTAQRRADRGLETSVNWEDNESVAAFTLASTANAGYGAARLLRQVIERASCYRISDPLGCERDRLPKNQYHGNIVFKGDLPKVLQKQLAATLAMKSEYVQQPKTAPQGDEAD